MRKEYIIIVAAAALMGISQHSGNSTLGVHTYY
jgi:hypothetical protein